MSWRPNITDWNHARTFLAAAEEGSYSKAARVLGLTQPTVGRQIAALEEELNVALFERAGRGVKLTPSGLELLNHVRVMAEGALRMSRAAAGLSQSLDGLIRLTAHETIAMHLLPPAIERIRSIHSGIEIEIVVTNETVDLRQREADIALRHFMPDDPELIARKLPSYASYFYATPAYLDKVGPLDTPAGLARADFIAFERNGEVFRRLEVMHPSTRMAVNFPIVSRNHATQWELVKRGLGIGLMLAVIGEAEPRVTRVFPNLGSTEFPMWLVCHRELNISRRVRVVFDLLTEVFSEEDLLAGD